MDNSLRKFLLNKAIKRGEQYAAMAEASQQDELFKRGVDESLRKEKLKQEVVLDKFERDEYKPLDVVLRQSRKGQEVRGLIYNSFEELKVANPDVESVIQKIKRLTDIAQTEDLSEPTETAIKNYMSGLQTTLAITPLKNIKLKNRLISKISLLLKSLGSRDASTSDLFNQQSLVDVAAKNKLKKIFTSVGNTKPSREDKLKILEDMGIDTSEFYTDDGKFKTSTTQEKINEKAFKNISALKAPASVAPKPNVLPEQLFEKYRKGSTTLTPGKPTHTPQVVDNFDDGRAAPPTERRIFFGETQEDSKTQEDEPPGDDEDETLHVDLDTSFDSSTLSPSERKKYGQLKEEEARRKAEEEARRKAEKEALAAAAAQYKGVTRTPQKPRTRSQTSTKTRPTKTKPSLDDDEIKSLNGLFTTESGTTKSKKTKREALTDLGILWTRSDKHDDLDKKWREYRDSLKKGKGKGKGKKAGFIKPLWNLIKDIPEGFRRISKPTKTISEIDPFLKELVKLTQTTYNSPVSSSNGWKNIYSNERVRVYKKKDVIIIAVRGTDKTNKEDLNDDLAIVKGTLDKSPRFLELKKIYEAALEQFPNAKIILTGHSLGGGMVIELSKYYPVQGVLFNPAINLNNLRSSSYNLKNIQTHIIEHDPLALTSSFLPNVSKYKFPFKLTGTPNDHIKAHELKTFLGGRLRRKTKK
ncbi:lipase [Cafeteriavirus-dependent mavirus]|nr:lipase [Cafeteriavirus-dependent mavirus]CAK6624541.1 lipase [Cafeteriavirus-dependent mavirus]